MPTRAYFVILHSKAGANFAVASSIGLVSLFEYKALDLVLGGAFLPIETPLNQSAQPQLADAL